MESKLGAAILGATGTVGQRLIALLEGHPWFEVASLAASDRSAGKRFADACTWLLPTPMPARIADMRVEPLAPELAGDFALSSLPGDIARQTEQAFAAAGYPVVTNSSAFRMDPDVPILIPEVNHSHLESIAQQRAKRWSGFIVTNPNCSAAALTVALAPIYQAFGLRRVLVSTMQAVSGAGYPGVPSLAILDNIVPHIDGESPKVESEPAKMLGRWGREDGFSFAPIAISAMVHRVPTIDGHMEAISLETERAASPADVRRVLEEFVPPAELAGLPSLPAKTFHCFDDPARPQTRLDRDLGNGMTVSVGPISICPVLGIKFRILGHNTMRGAAGAALLNAELLRRQGLLKRQ